MQHKTVKYMFNYFYIIDQILYTRMLKKHTNASNSAKQRYKIKKKHLPEASKARHIPFDDSMLNL